MLRQADKRLDMTKLIVAFLKFAKTPKVMPHPEGTKFRSRTGQRRPDYHTSTRDSDVIDLLSLNAEVRECLLSFGAESLVFQFAIQKFKF
jgi:hypothetical protein